MSLLFLVLYVVLSVFIVVMFARWLFDLMVSVNRGWRPRGALLVIAEAAYAITDPPIKVVRRLVPPVRFGSVLLDLAWSIVLLAALILSFVCTRFL